MKSTYEERFLEENRWSYWAWSLWMQLADWVFDWFGVDLE